MIGIYGVENTLNHMTYVGQSKDIKKRFMDHWYGKSKNLLSRAMKEFGKENFKFFVIRECTTAELDDYEIYYIKTLNTIYPNGYNILEGGRHNTVLCGEKHPNAVLTDNDVYMIREDYKNDVKYEDAYRKISDKARPGTFSSIWFGYSRKNIHMDVYTIQNKKMHEKSRANRSMQAQRVVSDSEVIKIRDIKNEGFLSRRETKELFPHMNQHTFVSIWNGKAFRHLQSNIPPKTRDGRSGVDNSHAKLSAENVRQIRLAKKNGILFKDVYKDYEEVISKRSFRDVWNGRTYQTV